jgi:hypothetical protein
LFFNFATIEHPELHCSYGEQFMIASALKLPPVLNTEATVRLHEQLLTSQTSLSVDGGEVQRLGAAALQLLLAAAMDGKALSGITNPSAELLASIREFGCTPEQAGILERNDS